MKTITYDDSLYCLVPIEPSVSMREAIQHFIPHISFVKTRQFYKAMLAASPMTILPQSTQPEPNLIAADRCCDFD